MSKVNKNGCRRTETENQRKSHLRAIEIITLKWKNTFDEYFSLLLGKYELF